MESLHAILRHPDDLYPTVKLKLAVRSAEKQIPAEPHWGFCYSMLHKVSGSLALVIEQLDTDLRDAVCIFYLVLRALDIVEDDTSIAAEVKVPILMAFHHHIYDREWHFSCGTKDYKVLMDEFHHVSTAFLELGCGYQEAIEDIAMRMGAGMVKFICKEVETVDDYDEYHHYVAALIGLGLSKLFHASGKEDLASDTLSNSMGLFLEKTNIVRDYVEDINEIPKSRMFWPHQIWTKYVNKLEDLQYEENSVKAVQCVNDMVTNALVHVEDCLKYMSALRDPAIFRFCAIPQIMAIETLALCYNNIQVFRGVAKMRCGLTAKVIDRTKTMSDVYGAFYDFSRMLKSKVDDNDPNARKMKDSLETILKICRDSGTLNQRKSCIIQSKPQCNPTLESFKNLLSLFFSLFYERSNSSSEYFPHNNMSMQIVVLFIILAILLAYLSASRPSNKSAIGAKFTFVNKCEYTVWPGILANPSSPRLESTGFELPQDSFRTFVAPAGWSGRFWGRTGCTFSASEPGSCLTGDCGSGEAECNGYGPAPPATLAEFTLGIGGLDFYDVSLVDGYNLPVIVIATGGSGVCSATGCVVDVNSVCPSELRVGGGKACKSACEAFGSPEYCCSGMFNSPAACQPSVYSRMFKSACPRSYSYAYDDPTSTFTCSGADYTVTFCPAPKLSQKSAKDPTPIMTATGTTNNTDGSPSGSGTSMAGYDSGSGLGVTRSDPDSASMPGSHAMLSNGSWLASLAMANVGFN